MKFGDFGAVLIIGIFPFSFLLHLLTIWRVEIVLPALLTFLGYFGPWPKPRLQRISNQGNFEKFINLILNKNFS